MFVDHDGTLSFISSKLNRQKLHASSSDEFDVNLVDPQWTDGNLQWTAEMLAREMFVNDTDLVISYSGTWSERGRFDGDEHYSETIGSEAIFTFTGSKVWFYGAKRNDLGIAEILLAGESANSSEISAMPKDTTAPAAPIGLGATLGDGSVSLD